MPKISKILIHDDDDNDEMFITKMMMVYKHDYLSITDFFSEQHASKNRKNHIQNVFCELFDHNLDDYDDEPLVIGFLFLSL